MSRITFQRSHSILIILTMLFVLIGAVPAQAATPVQSAPCSMAQDFKDVPKLGLACKLPNGNWKIKLKDGYIIETHGPDTQADPPASASSVAALAASSPVCVPTNTHFNMIIYAVPSDRTDRYSTMADTIRGYFQTIQDRLNDEAMGFGITASYKMACDTDGRVTVRHEVLPTAMGSSNYNTIASDLRAKGYTSSFAHYWVYWDGTLSGVCGQGEFHNDDRPVADNANNTGPRYGLSYGCNALMHENGHNMGAVQNSAPNASGAAHCNDDRDVMCYNDGGPNSGGYRNNVCTDLEHYDCNHDDYFHPNPPAGSYLATHWNVAACYNRYIQRSGCGGGSTPTPTRTATRTNTPTGPTATPTRTPTRTNTPSGPTFTPTRTATRTNTPSGPTATPTRTPTPGTGGACSPVTSTITAPFTFDGAGTFCWQSSNLGGFINSWNTASVTVNGTNYTNIWVSTSSLPTKINGFWYVGYNSSVAWGHFEAR
jgi:hypothetical protein